jgi:hypothetical protein
VEGANKRVAVECTCVTCSSTFSFLKKKITSNLPKECGDCIEKTRLKLTVECTCITCQVAFSFVKKNNKKLKSPKECTACGNETLRRQEEKEKESRKQRLLAEKPDYFMTYGVGYQFNVDEDDLSCTLENESLVGNYQLVFYKSDQAGNGEDIHRTARGQMELSLKEWDGKPSLFGTYKMATSASDNLGSTTSGNFIESVTRWHPNCNGFNIFDKDRDQVVCDEQRWERG